MKTTKINNKRFYFLRNVKAKTKIIHNSEIKRETASIVKKIVSYFVLDLKRLSFKDLLLYLGLYESILTN